MDFSKQIRFPNSGRSDSQRKSPKTNKKTSHESNENYFSSSKIFHHSKSEHRNSKSPFTSPLLQKRILTDKNNFSKSSKKSSHQKKTDSPLSVSTIESTPDSPYPQPYDLVTNYTSPRPQYLRYDPNRRMEIMLRVEKAMLDEEEGTAPCNNSISTFPQQSAEKPMQEEVPSQSNSSISTALQVQMPVCEEKKCLTDDEEEEEEEEEEQVEGTRYTKFGLNLVFLLLCLISSVCYISSMGSNLEMNLHARPSEVSLLGEMLGLSKKCLSRRHAELTCGVEEWLIVMEESKEFSLTGLASEEEMFSGGELEFDLTGTPEEEDTFTDGELQMTKGNDGIEVDIGASAQGNNVESQEVELHAVEHAHVFERSEALKAQVCLFYSMQTLAGLSFFITLIASYLHKHTIRKLFERRKQNWTSGTDVQKGSGVLKESTDEISTTIVGNSKMYVIQTSEVDLGESLFTNTSTGNVSSVQEVELEATPTASSTPQSSLEKIEKNTNLTEATATPLRRSSRLRSRLNSS